MTFWNKNIEKKINEKYINLAKTRIAPFENMLNF